MDWTQLPPQVVGILWALPTIAIAAVLAYGFGRRRATEDRRLHAKDVATALLIEARYVELLLREIYEDEKPLDSWWYLPLPWFEALFTEARTLRPTTVRAVYEFFGLVLELKARLQVYGQLQTRTHIEQHAVRAKAGYAVERLAVLVETLKREGGVLPPLQDYRGVFGDKLPPLPPVIFPEMLTPRED